MLSWLTPAERRGAALLVLIFVLGAAWDRWRAGRIAPGHPAPDRAPVAGAGGPRSDAAAPGTPDSVPRVRGGPGRALDLNRATALDLDALPGIGPVLAGRILAQRARRGPFRRLEDLLAVRGVGPRLLERLRPLVVVVGEPAARHGAVHSAQPDSLRRADSASVLSGPAR